MSLHEIELKLRVEERDAPALRRRASELAGGARGRTRKLLSIYFDTPDFALRKASMALRLRREGRHWVQTVKTRKAFSGGLSQAVELETRAPGGRMNVELIGDDHVRAEIQRLCAGSDLQKAVETAITRTTFAVELPGGRAEIAIDVGEIRAGGRTARLAEVELELVEGAPDVLYAAAGQLFEGREIRFSRLSKGERGFTLASEGTIEPPLEPRQARNVTLGASCSAQEAMRDLLRECFAQVTINIDVTEESTDPEGRHQLRVGLRRLRSLLKAFGPLGQQPDAVAVGEEARWLAAEVGHVRNLDVLLDEIVPRERATCPDEQSLEALAGALAIHAEASLTSLAGTLRGPRAQAFKLALARLATTQGWMDAADTAEFPAAARDLADAALAKSWKRVRKRGRKFGSLDVEQRHQLRKALKGLRYTAEFFRSFYPKKDVAAFLEKTKRVLEVFGHLNDAAMAGEMLEASGIAARPEPLMQRGVGWLLGAGQTRAEIDWRDAGRAWRDLKHALPFWE